MFARAEHSSAASVRTVVQWLHDLRILTQRLMGQGHLYRHQVSQNAPDSLVLLHVICWSESEYRQRRAASKWCVNARRVVQDHMLIRHCEYEPGFGYVES